MKRIEVILDVSPDRSAVLRLPEDVRPGKYEAVLVIDNVPKTEKKPIRLPIHNGGPWPEGFTVSREQLYGEE